MKLAFTKMHGLGNDFVIVQDLPPVLDIAALANRHTGIGFDQLLVVQASNKADFYCRIFNSDASEAEQCGNGMRCVARFVHEQGLTAKREFSIETLAGICQVFIQDYDHIRISMGQPKIQDALISLEPGLELSSLSLGNPHAIIKVPALDAAILSQEASIAKHSYFPPQGVNLGFMQILDKQQVCLRTFERGAGETLACGSNACAAAVAGILNGWLQSPVRVNFSLGSLLIEWQGRGHVLYMTGPASHVFSGNLSI